MLHREPLDLVVALNLTHSLHVGAPRTIAERVVIEVRQGAGRHLGSEAKRLRAAGIEVVLLQPVVHDLDAIGRNLRSSHRRHQVIKTTVRTVTEHLRNSPVGARLVKLQAAIPGSSAERPERPRHGPTSARPPPSAGTKSRAA